MTHAPKGSPGTTIATLRELLDKATPGPWYDDSAISGDGSVVMSEKIGRRVAHLPDADLTAHDTDAALIAALRNAAPDLLRVVEAVAEFDPECRDTGGQRVCAICGAGGTVEAMGHLNDCAWVLAGKLCGHG